MPRETLIQGLNHIIEEKKGVDPVWLDVRQRASFTDYLLIVSGTSSKHIQALADYIREAFPKPLNIEGQKQGEWILIDYGDVVVHLFQPQVRSLYSLEKLWSAEGDWDKDKILMDESESPLERKIRQLREQFTQQRGHSPA